MNSLLIKARCMMFLGAASIFGCCYVAAEDGTKGSVQTALPEISSSVADSSHDSNPNEFDSFNGDAIELALIAPAIVDGFPEVPTIEASASVNVQSRLLEQSARPDSSPTVDLFEYDLVESLVIAATEQASSDVAARELREQRIKRFFKRKWRGEKAVYQSLEMEFDLLARYYAQHDSAYDLITGLSKQPVYLGYATNTFRTDVKGDALRVRSVKILFDPRSAAVLGQDHSHRNHAANTGDLISSADALLHELLHADVVLNRGKEFIASGAMFSAFYPHEHESKVINLERQLFRDMTKSDGISRPQRNTHRGYLLASSCATCLQ